MMEKQMIQPPIDEILEIQNAIENLHKVLL